MSKIWLTNWVIFLKKKQKSHLLVFFSSNFWRFFFSILFEAFFWRIFFYKNASRNGKTLVKMAKRESKLQNVSQNRKTWVKIANCESKRQNESQTAKHKSKRQNASQNGTDSRCLSRINLTVNPKNRPKFIIFEFFGIIQNKI